MTHCPDEELTVSRLKDWLDRTRAEADAVPPRAAVEDLEPEFRAVGLYDVIEAFTTLRHELKLETKSARSLREQAEAVVQSLQVAIDHFRSVEPREEEAAFSAGRALALALADLDEALGRGLATVESARHQILNDAPRELSETLDEMYRDQPFWRRWVCRRYHRAVHDLWLRRHNELHKTMIESLRDGYALIHARLKKMMKEEQVLPIPCVGEQVDTHTMNVVEIVDAPDRPAGIVIDEVRRGYWWRTKVLRCAEVRATRRDNP